MGQVALEIQRRLADKATLVRPGRDIQNFAIHFALSFWFLSECEYQCLNWTTTDRRFELHSFNRFHSTRDNDCNESRDCVYYFDIGLIFQQGWKLLVHSTFGLMLFWLVAMPVLNYPIKCLVNPARDDPFDLGQLMFGTFFTAESHWCLVDCLILPRPVRLLNRMLFWTIKNSIEGLWV